MRYSLLAALVATIGLSSIPRIAAQTPAAAPHAVDLKAGDQAPDFALPGSDGKTWKLSDLRGKAVVLAWFPKAFTGG